MIISNDLTLNLILDFRKNKIDKVERARIIKYYLMDNGISVSELGRRIGVSASTIEDWLIYSQIDTETYHKLQASAWSEGHIKEMLKDTKKDDMNITEAIKMEAIDKDVRQANCLLNKYLQLEQGTIDTITLLKDHVNLINRIVMRIERRVKR